MKRPDLEEFPVKMSIDEIRSQKALALLEFREAEEEVVRLIKEKDRLGGAFHSIGAALQGPEDVTEADLARYAHATIAVASALARKLSEARKQLAEALAKKKQFGL